MHQLRIFDHCEASTASAIHRFSDAQSLLGWWEKQKHDVRPVRDGPMFGLFTTKKNRKGRKKSDIDMLSAIVLDIDECNPDELDPALQKLSSYNYIIYSTHNSTNEALRFRVIVPLAAPVSAEAYEKRNLGSCLAELIGISVIDDASNRPAQVYYLPSCPDERDAIFEVHSAEKTLSIHELPANLPKVKAKKSSFQNDIDHDKLVAEARHIIDDAFGGNLIFFGNRFYFYEEGRWIESVHQSFEQKLLTTTFQLKKSLASVQQVMRMIEVLTYCDRFPTIPDEKEVIVLRNCAVDLMNGKPLSHSPAHYARNRLDYDFDTDATCPTWENFLRDIWRNDADLDDKINLLQEEFGYSLTRSVAFQKMFWLIGEGSNGKSVILDLLREMVGHANVSAVPLSKFGQRFALAQLFGKLVNISPEISSTAVLADSEFKSVVAGDAVTLERKLEHPFEAKLETKLWAAANHLPKTKDHSHGFFRRIIILTFVRIIAEHEQDKSLGEKLKNELPGIFNWSLKGLHRLLKNGQFTIPLSSLHAITEYKTESNNVALFVRDHIEIIDPASPRTSGTRPYEVYAAYAKFCRSNGYSPLGNSEFGKRLAPLGLRTQKSNGKTYYPVRLMGMEIYGEGYQDTTASNSGPKHEKLADQFEDD